MDYQDNQLPNPANDAADCPPPDVLAAFLAGDDDLDRGFIETHLLDCDRCVQVLGQATAEVEELEVPRLVVERAAALVSRRSMMRGFLRGPGAVPRTALAAAAALAFAFVGYHVGQVNGDSSTSGSDFIHVVSFESIGGTNMSDDLQSILLASTGNRP